VNQEEKRGARERENLGLKARS